MIDIHSSLIYYRCYMIFTIYITFTYNTLFDSRNDYEPRYVA